MTFSAEKSVSLMLLSCLLASANPAQDPSTSGERSVAGGSEAGRSGGDGRAAGPECFGVAGRAELIVRTVPHQARALDFPYAEWVVA